LVNLPGAASRHAGPQSGEKAMADRTPRPNPRPIDPAADLPPETVNLSQDDEQAQSQSVAAAASSESADDFGLDDSDKVPSGNPDDDVQDLVDHMHDMVNSGRIDMDAYRGERNDDDEEGALGPDGELD
jgi:hypothetical protein